MHTEIPYIREIILFLAAAGLVMPVVRKLNVSPVIGFLCIGLLVGPFGLGRLEQEFPVLGYLVVTEMEGIQMIGELGVAFLLFSIGLELSLPQLWSMRRIVFGLGSAQIAISALVIASVALALGSDGPTAILLGLCLALSSTAIVMQLLSEQLRLGSQVGRNALGILLMQDLAVVPILLFIGFLAASTDGSVLAAALLSIGEAIAVIAVIFVTGRVVVRPILRFAASNGSREMFMASVLLLILGTSALTAAAGLSFALGAFLAGLLFSGTEYRHQINSDIEPFKGLLLGLFFISIGMRLDLLAISGSLGWIALAAISLIVVKALIITALARLFRAPAAVAVETGLLLGEGGEFALVAVTAALAAGVLAPDIAAFVIALVILTMFATPLLDMLGRRAGRKIAIATGDKADKPSEDAASECLVIGGFGRVGRMLGKILEDQRIAYIALDADANLVAELRNSGAPVFYADASNPELLRQIGIRKAKAFVTTMDEPGAAETVVSAIHQSWPHVPIFARARDPDHARRLRRLGAMLAVPETTEASLQLSEAMLVGLGMPEDVARTIVESERKDITFDPEVSC